MSLKYNAVLFDLDGTIIDSAPGIYKTLLATFEHYGVKKNISQLKKYLGPPLRETMAENLPPEKVEEATQYYRDIYEVDGLYNASVYKDAGEMLRRIKDAGCTICLATCKPKIVAEAVLRHFKLYNYFDYIGGASLDASIDTKTDVIKSVLSKACMRSKAAVMVGDRDNDMQGAVNCGLPRIGALYGYGSKDELMPFKPEFLAKTTLQISDYITKSTD